MSLKTKWILLLSISGFILVLILALGFRSTMLPYLREQKTIFIEKFKKKVQVALAIEEENISILCRDWSDWDSLVQYLKEPSAYFERNAMPDVMFSDGMMDLVVIYNKAKAIVYYRNFRPNRGFIALSDMDIRGEFDNIGNILTGKVETIKGLANTPIGPVLFTAYPILDRSNLNSKEGVLVMGRYVDERMLQRFSSYTVEKIQTISLNRHQLRSFFLRQMGGRDLMFTQNESEVTIFHMLKDIHQEPAMVLFTTTDNRLFQVVRYQITAYIVMTSILVIFLGFAFYFVIQKQVFKRMMDISAQMSRIEGFDELSIRIDRDRKKDEVSHLASSINRTLDRLEQEKLKRENAEKTMLKQGKLASIGRLSSSIAHEINNPLMAINTSIQVIKKMISQDEPISGEDEEFLREAVDISESEVERIRDIISGLLDFHRLDREDFCRLSLNKIMKESIAILNWGKKLKSIDIYQIGEEDCFVRGAPIKLKQVFINFILNAAEAAEVIDRESDRRGALTIEITPSTDGKVAFVHFVDNGPGLAPEVKGSLYEPFVTTKDDTGVGLGLYISYKIIQSHMGEIVYDEEYKDGTHFIIKLPIDGGQTE